MFPVQPKPPQGFKDYLMNRCTYVLAGTSPTTPNVTFPPTLQVLLKDLFADQEKERYNLRMQVYICTLNYAKLLIIQFLACHRERKISFVGGTGDIESTW